MERPVRLSDTLPKGAEVLKTSKQSYVHRGDRIRRNDRVKKVLLVVGLVVAVAFIPRQQPRDAQASSVGGTFTFGLSGEAHRLRAELDATKGELELANAQLARARTIMTYSSRYHVGADLAGSIYDIALAEGIEPDLAFRLVRVESEFNPRATSSAGAVGLTQLMLATARDFDPHVTREQLYEPRTNLRIGFRYLRSLIKEYHGDVRLALLVYNRGPVAVETLRSLGVNPGNGYDVAVMKGYTGTGVVE
ncbi:MAG: transglycosylase SLT domain-containing protein [Gemmatimonadaceae bacterium]|nr:transglycosylase SLT domain-containing protein [Gemmatimonadaceae bacterium]